MSKTVSSWRCKCGVRVKVVAEITTENPQATVLAACPKCGEKQTINADTVVSVTAEKSDVLS